MFQLMSNTDTDRYSDPDTNENTDTNSYAETIYSNTNPDTSDYFFQRREEMADCIRWNAEQFNDRSIEPDG